MSSLDNLISKIRSDSEAQARRIIDAANAEAEAIIEKGASEAEAERKSMLAAAADEAAMAAQRITLEKKLEIRDDTLRAKREVIDRVFSLALSKLKDLPKERYLVFMNASLEALTQGNALNADAGGFVLILAHDVAVSDVGMAGVSINEARRASSGFILQKEGVEYNFTFEALLESQRHELEYEIAQILFR